MENKEMYEAPSALVVEVAMEGCIALSNIEEDGYF